MTKKLLDPTTIRPELLTEWQEKCAAMKAASDRFSAANAAYYALTGNPAPSVAGLSRDEAALVYAQSNAERTQRIMQRVTAYEEATARYLDWQDAQRAFFTVCDHIQQEAVV